MSHLDPEAERKAELQKKSATILRRLNGPLREEGSFDEGEVKRPRKEDLVLNQYEQAIAMEVVAPEDIPVSFEGTVGPEFCFQRHISRSLCTERLI